MEPRAAEMSPAAARSSVRKPHTDRDVQGGPEFSHPSGNCEAWASESETRSHLQTPFADPTVSHLSAVQLSAMRCLDSSRPNPYDPGAVPVKRAATQLALTTFPSHLTRLTLVPRFPMILPSVSRSKQTSKQLTAHHLGLHLGDIGSSSSHDECVERLLIQKPLPDALARDFGHCPGYRPS
ncbi:hypothetical protein NM208_g13142 [Fusarium decemcellulare]|uniref:Uncharacterized protein n=1 Tax=Fusarium decemcellulare TaxID=57161 RepID=A0ACC1RQ97_9HYPO|nr:hypothetical protein NM208_g13142 [Fusarium decemcellulare]